MSTITQQCEKFEKDMKKILKRHPETYSKNHFKKLIKRRNRQLKIDGILEKIKSI